MDIGKGHYNRGGHCKNKRGCGYKIKGSFSGRKNISAWFKAENIAVFHKNKNNCNYRKYNAYQIIQRVCKIVNIFRHIRISKFKSNSNGIVDEMNYYSDPEGTGTHYEITDAKPEDKSVGHLDKVEMENSENKGGSHNCKNIAETAEALHNCAAENHFLNKSRGKGEVDYVKDYSGNGFRNFIFRHGYPDADSLEAELKKRNRIGSKNGCTKTDENSADGKIHLCFAERQSNFKRHFYAQRIYPEGNNKGENINSKVEKPFGSFGNVIKPVNVCRRVKKLYKNSENKTCHKRNCNIAKGCKADSVSGSTDFSFFCFPERFNIGVIKTVSGMIDCSVVFFGKTAVFSVLSQKHTSDLICLSYNIIKRLFKKPFNCKFFIQKQKNMCPF